MRCVNLQGTPISYTFLNQIENSAEYGTNGY